MDLRFACSECYACSLRETVSHNRNATAFGALTLCTSEANELECPYSSRQSCSEADMSVSNCVQLVRDGKNRQFRSSNLTPNVCTRKLCCSQSTRITRSKLTLVVE